MVFTVLFFQRFLDFTIFTITAVNVLGWGVQLGGECSPRLDSKNVTRSPLTDLSPLDSINNLIHS